MHSWLQVLFFVAFISFHLLNRLEFLNLLSFIVVLLSENIYPRYFGLICVWFIIRRNCITNFILLVNLCPHCRQPPWNYLLPPNQILKVYFCLFFTLLSRSKKRQNDTQISNCVVWFLSFRTIQWIVYAIFWSDWCIFLLFTAMLWFKACKRRKGQNRGTTQRIPPQNMIHSDNLYLKKFEVRL